MAAPARVVLPELLDELAPADPRAARSRRDLRRIHRAMRTVSIMRRAAGRLRLARPPRRVLELGGGDGSLLLRVARSLHPRWTGVELTILDRHALVSEATVSGYRAVGWTVRVRTLDVREWVAQGEAAPFDLCTACLFLHHFETSVLASLMHAIAANARAFIACEPRRSALAGLGSALVGVLGANVVTRADAVTSVRAGFTRQELTALWPQDCGRWSCHEYPAWPFSHCFTAVSADVRRA